MCNSEWTFVTSYFRNHGIAFLGMILRYLHRSPLYFENITELPSQIESKINKIDQMSLALLDKLEFPKCISNVIYFIPENYDNAELVSAYPEKIKNNLPLLISSLAEEYKDNIEKDHIIERFADLIKEGRDYWGTAKKKWQKKDWIQLWQIAHEMPLKDQIEWFKETNGFGIGVVEIGPWKKIKETNAKIKIVTLPLYQNQADDIEDWTNALDSWVSEITGENEKYGINLQGTSHADMFGWRHLQTRRIALKNAKFLGFKTLSQHESKERFRPIFVFSEKQRLFEEKVSKDNFESWWSADRKKVKTDLECYDNWSDLFSIVIFGPRGSGKSRLIKEVFSEYTLEQNCAAIPEDLAESMLFGHKKGSFTGTTEDYPGVFGELEKKYNTWKINKDKQNKPVLFLDEFHHLSLRIQSKLLGALQQDNNGYFSYSPIGGFGDTQKGGHKGLTGKLRFQLIVGTNRSEIELRKDPRILQDLLDRVLQRKLSMPFLSLDELEGAWIQVWKNMSFIPNVENPIYPESGPGGKFVQWLKNLHKKGKLEGNFRDLQRIAIFTADLIRSQNKNYLEKMDFHVLQKEWEGGLENADIFKTESFKYKNSSIFPDEFHNWLSQSMTDNFSDAMVLSNKCRSEIAKAVEKRFGGLTKLPKGFKPDQTTLRRWKGF